MLGTKPCYNQNMYKPVDQLPPEFAKRCQNIIDGVEKIDSLEKLKGFLEFTIEQGYIDRNMRESMLIMCSHALGSTCMFDKKHRFRDDLPGAFKRVFGEIWDNDYIGPSPHPDYESDEEFSDKIWGNLKSLIDKC